VNPELLDILCCPETHQKLALADPALVERLNAKALAGTLKNRAGQTVGGKLDGGLLRADGLYLYPIRDGLPNLLIDEAVLVGD